MSDSATPREKVKMCFDDWVVSMVADVGWRCRNFDLYQVGMRDDDRQDLPRAIDNELKRLVREGRLRRMRDHQRTEGDPGDVVYLLP
jgi:hypothetical protein